MLGRLKHIGPLQAGKVTMVMSLFFGIIVALLAIPLGLSEAKEPGAILMAIVVVPLLYAIGGFVTGIVWAVFYNIAAKWVGGYEGEFTPIDKK